MPRYWRRCSPRSWEGRAAARGRVTKVHLEVGGKVQGVGFRWFVREAARRAGVAGWVRNRPDGRVEIAASGTEAAIADLMSAARTGPPGALVDHVAELPCAGLEDLPRPFTVMR
jgi:acylphosphatase